MGKQPANHIKPPGKSKAKLRTQELSSSLDAVKFKACDAVLHAGLSDPPHSGDRCTGIISSCAFSTFTTETSEQGGRRHGVSRGSGRESSRCQKLHLLCTIQ